MSPAPGRIVITGGTSWYLWNFRRNAIIALAAAGWEVIAVAPRDEHSRLLEELDGVRWLEWTVDMNGARPGEELAALLRLVGIIRRTGPQFVLNHGIKSNIYGGLACRFLKIPYANNITGLGMMIGRSGLGPKALARLYAFACGRARTLFIQNENDLETLRDAGLTLSMPVVQTVGSGVDLDHFAFAPLPTGARQRVFLFVGRLQRDKGIFEFVDAARLLRAEFPSARFVVVGSVRHANLQAVPADVLQRWSDEGVVEVAGHQDDVRPWLAAAHVLVMPSHGGEGVPKIILEAAATGRPTIASDVAGCRDAVMNEVTGLICKPRNTAALLAAMRQVATADDRELTAMGRAARMHAENCFSDVHLINAILAAVLPN